MAFSLVGIPLCSGILPISIQGLCSSDLNILWRLPSATDFLTIAKDLTGGRQEVSITCPDLVSGERFWDGLSQWLKEG